ncbi:MAG: Na+/H+ antiporter subunit D [Opitutales bacterium]
MLVALPIALPLLTAIACLFARRSVGLQRALTMSGSVLQLVAAIVLLLEVNGEGIQVLVFGGWPAPQGIVVVADLFSAIMVLITALMGLTVGLYALGSISSDHEKHFFHPLYQFLLLGVNGAFLTGDLFNLFVWFEVMLISSFVLLALGGTRPQLDGALKYVVLNVIASTLFLAGVGILYGKLGTLNMADVAMTLETHPDREWILSSAVLLVVSFGLKAGIFPFFFWLPASYHTPPTAIAAIFAGLLTKVGVYALIRSFTLLFPAETGLFHELLIILAGFTMVTGVLGAAAHYDIKRILSFHIISQIGYMIMGLAIFTPLALAGAVFYLVHHIIVKTNLFLIGGIVERLRGTGQLLRIGGLYPAFPLLAVLFFIPAFSLGGIPPLSGFWAKFTVVKAGLDAEHWWLVGVALAVGSLTLYSMTKIWAEAFWKRSDEANEPITAPAPPSLREKLLLYSPVAVLCLCTILLGFFGQPIFELCEAAGHQLLERTPYLEAVGQSMFDPLAEKEVAP